MVDEFAAIVRIDAEQGKGQPMPDGFQRLEGPHLRFILYRLGFCPARVHVGRVERLCVVSRRIAAAMGDQIDFDEAGFLLVPFRERADRDLMFEQRAWFIARAPAQPQAFALGASSRSIVAALL